MPVFSYDQKETAYRVIGRLSFDYQIIIQAKNSEEVAYFATDIDLDKWTESESDWEVLDVSKNYFLKRVKVEQNVDLSNQIGEKN